MNGQTNQHSKTLLIIGLVALMMMGLGGCVPAGMVSAHDIGPALKLRMRDHDAYVLADSTLTETKRRNKLETSRLLVKSIDDALREGE